MQRKKDAPSNTELPKLDKREFGKRLYRWILKKGWTQSELARRSGLTRNQISIYVRGASAPTFENFMALARCLEIDVSGFDNATLLPDIPEAAEVSISTIVKDEEALLDLRILKNAPGKALLRVSRTVSIATATQIINLLNDDETNGGASSDRK